MELTNFGPIAQATAKNIEIKNKIEYPFVTIGVLIVVFFAGVTFALCYQQNNITDNRDYA